MIAKSRIEKQTCNRCGTCCRTHPCALAPDDLGKIAFFLRMSRTDVFRRYLVLDYTIASSRKLRYLCPARVGDKPGRAVDWDWSFTGSPCIFLHGNSCAIEPVKPRGGRTFSCRLISRTGRNRVTFGKKRAAETWTGNPLLSELLTIAKTQPPGILDYDRFKMTCA